MSEAESEKPRQYPEIRCPFCGVRNSTHAGQFFDYPATCEGVVSIVGGCGRIFAIRFVSERLTPYG